MYHVHIIKYHGRSSAKLTVIQSSIDHHGHLGNLDNLGTYLWKMCMYICVIIHVGVTEACPSSHLPGVSPHSAVPGAWFPAAVLLGSSPQLLPGQVTSAATCTPAVATMPPLLLLLCLVLVTGNQPTTTSTSNTGTRHHEDDEINAKMERYVALLRRRRDAIDRFLADNYSDFNHSDYTPEVRQLIQGLPSPSV